MRAPANDSRVAVARQRKAACLNLPNRGGFRDAPYIVAGDRDSFVVRRASDYAKVGGPYSFETAERVCASWNEGAK